MVPSHFRILPNHSASYLLPRPHGSKPFSVTSKPLAITSKRFLRALCHLNTSPLSRWRTLSFSRTLPGFPARTTFRIIECRSDGLFRAWRSWSLLQVPQRLDSTFAIPQPRRINRSSCVSIMAVNRKIETGTCLQRLARSSLLSPPSTKSGSPTQSHSHRKEASYEFQRSPQTGYGGSRS